MSEFLSLTDRFSEGAARELSFPPTAPRRGRTRGDVNGGSSSPLHNKRHNDHTAVAFGAFVSALAILFLLSHCRAFSKKALQKRVGRRLAGEQETKGGGSAGSAPEVCGGGEPSSDTAAHSHKRPRDPSWGDPFGEESEDDGEPLSKMWHGGSDWQQAGSPTPFHDIESAAKSAEDEEAALGLSERILSLVEEILSEEEGGFEEEDWLRLPFEELEFLNEGQEPEPDDTLTSLPTGPAAASVTSGLTAVVTGPAAESGSSGFTDVAAGPSAVSDPCGLTTAVTGPPVGSATSGSTDVVSVSPEDDSSGNASPGEGSTQSSNQSSGETVSPVDAQVTSPGGTDMQSGEKLPRPHGTGGTTVLFRHVGQRGSNVAYMVVGSEISDPQGRKDLTITSSRLAPPAGQEGNPSKVDIGTHPFCRLPRSAPGASVREIILISSSKTCHRSRCQTTALWKISRILKKPVVDSGDLEHLMQNLEHLVDYATHCAKENLDALQTRFAAEKLGFALLLIDGIYAASEVLGEKARRSEWWQQVVERFPVYTVAPVLATLPFATRQKAGLSLFLARALGYYRCGMRPPEQLLVALKQVLLCTSAVPQFTRGPWADYIEDDTEWQQSQ